MVYAKGKLYIIVNEICYQNVDIVYSFVTDPTLLLIESLRCQRRQKKKRTVTGLPSHQRLEYAATTIIFLFKYDQNFVIPELHS